MTILNSVFNLFSTSLNETFLDKLPSAWGLALNSRVIDSNFSLSISENSLSSANMINYHTDTKSLTYENFDADSYPNRNLKALTYDKSPSLIKSAGASVKNDGELKTNPYIL